MIWVYNKPGHLAPPLSAVIGCVAMTLFDSGFNETFDGSDSIHTVVISVHGLF